MSWLTRTLKTGTGRKALAALSGLALVGFLVIHLIGNLQIFASSDALNEYAHALHDSWFIVLGDVGLLILFPLHIGLVLWLVLDNKKARGDVGYKKHASKQDRSLARVLASKTSLIGGLLLMAFVIVHIFDFRLAHDDLPMKGEFKDVKGAIIDTLSNPLHALLYMVGSVLVAWHLFHGVQAAFRSLGFDHPRWTPIIEKGGLGLAIVLAVGFVSIPLWILVR